MSAALARLLLPGASRRFYAVLTSLLMLLVFVATRHSINFGYRPGEHEWELYEDVFHQIDSMRLDSAARLYAAPNRQLVLSFYSGVPIQDISPVRKSYLDSYRGDIVYIDADGAVATGILDPKRVREAALRNGYKLSSDAAEEMSISLRARPYRESILEALAPGQPFNLEPLPPFARELLAAQRAKVEFDFKRSGYDLLTRGMQVRDWSDWMTVFKYRFVDPEARRGIYANYLDRLRGADATIVGRDEPGVIYRSRWHPRDSAESLSFRFVP
jgi:hypothetical protein